MLSLKAISDAVHDNDAQIHEIHASKIWGEHGEIRVEALK